jgi:ABC-type branched-subunit amino acid transport system permease subunit
MMGALSDTRELRYRDEKRILKGHLSTVILLLFVLGTLVMPMSGNRYIIYISTLIVINAIAAQGLSFLMGYTGQISLGHGGFMAIGAYLTPLRFTWWSPWDR